MGVWEPPIIKVGAHNYCHVIVKYRAKPRSVFLRNQCLIIARIRWWQGLQCRFGCTELSVCQFVCLAPACPVCYIFSTGKVLIAYVKFFRFKITTLKPLLASVLHMEKFYLQKCTRYVILMVCKDQSRIYS